MPSTHSEGLTAAAGDECGACVHRDMISFGQEFASTILRPSALPTCSASKPGIGADEGVWHSLELRGSVRTCQLMAVLHVKLGGMDGGAPEAAWERELATIHSWCCAYALEQQQRHSTCTDGSTMALKVVLLSVLDGAGTEHKDTVIWSSQGNEGAAAPTTIEEVLTSPSTQTTVKFRVSPGAFFQTNTPAANVLFDLIHRCAYGHTFNSNGAIATDTSGGGGGGSDSGGGSGGGGGPVLLDLCCGTGAIALTVRHAGSTALGVDISQPAIDDATSNRELNGVPASSTEFICGKVGEKIGALITRACQQHRSRDIIAICDPPRNGMRPSVSVALRSCAQVRRIVYISCNPEDKFKRKDFVVKGGSLWDNARVLCGPGPGSSSSSGGGDGGGGGAPFKLTYAQPVDLFPHTPHVELVCVFDRVDVLPNTV